ncbi:hypothetical protein LB504_002684 [Fusarium proliferatum]|nr:hypothetical protein LB504_002684 [Fusarium proliferatum]
MNLDRMSAWSCFLVEVAAAPGILPLCVPCEPSHRRDMPPHVVVADLRKLAEVAGEFAGKPYDNQPSSKQQYLTNVGTLTSSDAVQKETSFVKCFISVLRSTLPKLATSPLPRNREMLH